MQKRMLYVSKNISNDIKAKLSLWRGQCSCAYWHGIFGGLYLPHLRAAIYQHLIEAENTNITTHIESFDFDADGEKEIVYSNENFFFVIKTRKGSFIEIDDRKRKLNILNYIGRRKEKYHQRISTVSHAKTLQSIHETLRSKEKNLQRYLIYDRYERSFGLDHRLTHVPTLEDFRCGKNLGTIIDYQKYEVLDKKRPCIKFSGEIEKRIEIAEENSKMLQLKYQADNRLLGIEFSLGLFGNNLRLKENKKLTETQALDNINEFTILADNLSPIKFAAHEIFSLLAYPIETVSSSEAGFEKNFQGFCLLLIFEKSPTISIKL